MKRSLEVYREVGEAHGIASLQRLLLADEPAWDAGRAWAEAGEILRDQWQDGVDLIHLLKQSLSGQGPV